MYQITFDLRIFTDCRAGKYGENCKETCQCENGGTCNIVTGHCLCPDGFIGPNCSQPCPAGTFGENCAENCGCLNGGDCNTLAGVCNCPPGHTGDKCQECKYRYLKVL